MAKTNVLQIHTLLFSALPNDTHFEFFSKVKDELARAGEEVRNAVIRLMPEFNDRFAMEQDNLEWIRKSNLTAEIAAADRTLDRYLTGLFETVNGARHGFNPLVVQAAERIYIVLKGYGRTQSKDYEQKLGAVSGIVDNLRGKYHDDIDTVGLAEWVMEIDNAQAHMHRLLQDRDVSTLNKPATGFRETRRKIENVWREMIFIINGAVAVGLTPTQFNAFINRLNPEIDRLNDTYHRVKHDIAAARPDNIPPQQYTGRPITPLPYVLFVTPKETAQLSLGKDFNVSYKNNVEVGSAKCIIRGKGDYRGQNIVTFTIVR